MTERTQPFECVAESRRGNSNTMFLFFSNRFGCLGSLAVSALATLVLILILRVAF